MRKKKHIAGKAQKRRRRNRLYASDAPWRPKKKIEEFYEKWRGKSKIPTFLLPLLKEK